MLAIHYCRQDERTQRFLTQRPQIAIGRDPDNDLVLDDPRISPHHCQVIHDDGAWRIEDLRSDHGTSVNGAPVHQRRPLLTGDRIFVGAFVIELEELGAREAGVEDSLLEAIAHRDDSARAVYADWLEERGHAARAEYLRLQASIHDPPIGTTATAQWLGFVNLAKRLRELASAIDVGWRIRVARPRVEGCRLQSEPRCKMDWGMLEPTRDPQLRTCTTCRKPVQYCFSEAEAMALASSGHRVAVDWAPFTNCCARCGRDSPENVKVCAPCEQLLAKLTDLETATARSR